LPFGFGDSDQSTKHVGTRLRSTPDATMIWEQLSQRVRLNVKCLPPIACKISAFCFSNEIVVRRIEPEHSDSFPLGSFSNSNCFARLPINHERLVGLEGLQTLPDPAFMQFTWSIEGIGEDHEDRHLECTFHMAVNLYASR